MLGDGWQGPRVASRRPLLRPQEHAPPSGLAATRRRAQPRPSSQRAGRGEQRHVRAAPRRVSTNTYNSQHTGASQAWVDRPDAGAAAHQRGGHGRRGGRGRRGGHGEALYGHGRRERGHAAARAARVAGRVGARGERGGEHAGRHGQACRAECVVARRACGAAVARKALPRRAAQSAHGSSLKPSEHAPPLRKACRRVPARAALALLWAEVWWHRRYLAVRWTLLTRVHSSAQARLGAVAGGARADTVTQTPQKPSSLHAPPLGGAAAPGSSGRCRPGARTRPGRRRAPAGRLRRRAAARTRATAAGSPARTRARRCPRPRPPRPARPPRTPALGVVGL